MPNEEMVRSYADVAIGVGLGIGSGDRVLIEIPTVLSDFAIDLVEVAYERGAQDVEVVWEDVRVDRARFTHGGEASISTVSGQNRSRIRAFESGVSYLRVLAEDPSSMAGIDPDLIRRFTKVNRSALFAARAGQMKGEVPWTVISAPVPPWTRSVFPEADMEEGTEEMWNAIFRACRIDRPDPVSAWHSHLDDLARRARHLTDRHYEALRYRGPGTDLEVGLTDGVVWQGGGATNSAGRRFCPNIPTEEVFTSPHRLKATGRVAATKPLSYFGSLISEFWVEFENGAVVDSDAGEGGDVLARILETDEGSMRLGEAAMVPQSGTVAAEGLVWNNALYDENDACHLALGQSYPICLEGGIELSEDEKIQSGLNTSSVHVDFVVGSPQVSVHGVTRDGTEESIIVDGEWGFTAD